jgi:hypothetical protein
LLTILADKTFMFQNFALADHVMMMMSAALGAVFPSRFGVRAFIGFIGFIGLM